MSRSLRLLLLAVAVLAANQAIAKSPFSLVNFRKSKAVAKSSMLLTEDNGPWMIFVAAFAGEGAEAESRQLVEKLRTDFRVDAYLHKQHYDYTDPVRGKGFDKYGNPKKMRFASEAAFDEIAVLIGDYPSVDDERLQKTLRRIKYATADELSLRGKSTPTTRRFAGIRSIMQRNSDDRKKGPMGNAFATRNPLVPRDALAAQQLDSELIALNKGVKYSLLSNPGKYTVRVASFRGQVVIDQRKIHEIENNQAKLDGRINSTDEKAESLARILREEEGVEAYVYHDRHESIVTVGSFAEIGRKLPNGTIDLIPQVAEIIMTYGPKKERLPSAGVPLAGIQPKSMRGFVFDVAPQPVLVPGKSTDSDYLSSSR